MGANAIHEILERRSEFSKPSNDERDEVRDHVVYWHEVLPSFVAFCEMRFPEVILARNDGVSDSRVR